MMRSIGEAILVLRQQQKMSQSELAKRTKLSLQTIEQIEGDDDSVTLGSMRRAAYALGYRAVLQPLAREPEESIDKSDERYQHRNDLDYWSQRQITLDDLPYLFPAEGESVYDRVLARATEVFESRELAQGWMHSEVPALKGDKPIDLITNEDGERQILAVLRKIETGDFS